MRVLLTDPGLVSDLVAFLRRARCTAEPESGMTLRVGIPEVDEPGAAELELDLYLRAWEAMNPGVQATRLAD